MNLIALLVAAEAPPEIESITSWLFDQIGMVVVLAVFAYLFATGRIVAGNLYREQVEANQKLIAANDKHADANQQNASGVKLSVDMMKNIARTLEKGGGET